MKNALLLLITLMLLAGNRGIADTTLNVKPTKCVAMNKGQVCYQTLRFSFAAPVGNYCLVSESQEAPIKCWRSTRTGQYTHPFESNADIEYVLVNDQQQAVATTNVAVAWVYKKSRARNRWRLF